jgi:hypothetical protein
LATRVALQVLDPKRYEEVPTNYIVWGREKGDYGAPFKFDLPLSLNYVPIARRLDCPVCGTPAAELNGLEIDEQYSSILASVDSVSG